MWEFHSAFTAAAGVLPTLLLALVLEKQLLFVATEYSRSMRRAFDELPKWMRRLLPFVPTAKLMPSFVAPKAMVLFAVFAEIICLVGVAVPTEWMEHPIGRVVSTVALVTVGYTVLMLLLIVAIGLITVAEEAEANEGGDPTTEASPD